jgi:hypothetical protein
VPAAAPARLRQRLDAVCAPLPPRVRLARRARRARQARALHAGGGVHALPLGRRHPPRPRLQPEPHARRRKLHARVPATGVPHRPLPAQGRRARLRKLPRLRHDPRSAPYRSRGPHSSTPRHAAGARSANASLS